MKDDWNLRDNNAKGLLLPQNNTRAGCLKIVVTFQKYVSEAPCNVIEIALNSDLLDAMINK